MNPIQTFQVFPAIPEAISFLEVLARNLWWCWHLNAIELFRRINPKLWAKSGRNPLLFLTLVSQNRLAELAEDGSFVSQLESVKHKFEQELPDQVAVNTPLPPNHPSIAYFSMEFGIHESLPFMPAASVCWRATI